MYAMPAPPADASKPGRATNTQVSRSTLGKRPHNNPATAPPILPKRRDNFATAPTTNKPQTASSAIHARSPLLQMCAGPPVKTGKARKDPITHTCHAHTAMNKRQCREVMSCNSTVACPINGRKIPLHASAPSRGEKIAKGNRFKHWSKRLSPNRPHATDSISPEFRISLVYPVYLLTSEGDEL